MSKKTYSVAGVSKLNGKFKVRFTHDLAYVKGLTKAGNTDVELLELPKAMVKGEAVKVLLASELMKRTEYAQAIEAADQKDRKSTRLNSSHSQQSRMPSSA